MFDYFFPHMCVFIEKAFQCSDFLLEGDFESHWGIAVASILPTRCFWLS